MAMMTIRPLYQLTDEEMAIATAEGLALRRAAENAIRAYLNFLEMRGIYATITAGTGVSTNERLH